MKSIKKTISRRTFTGTAFTGNISPSLSPKPKRKLRKIIVSVGIASAIVGGGYAYTHKQGVSVLNCDPHLWTFVYHPQRLKVLEACKTVEGVLVNAVQEKDGDWHGRLDVQDKSLINQDNIAGQHGYLVLESICQGWTTQLDAVLPCKAYDGPIIDFGQYVGKKIRVTGTFIQDAEHNKGAGGWLELHPVTSVVIIK